MEPVGADTRRFEWKRWGIGAALALALTIVTWPVGFTIAQPGIDPSWMLALELAHNEGMDWGRDIVFTYGPLGIGIYPVATASGTLIASLLLAFLMHFLMVAAIFLAFRRQYGLLVTTVLTYIVAGAVGTIQADETVVAAFGFSVLALTVPPRAAQRAALALAIGGGALAAFSLLVKLNNGVAVAMIVAAALAAAPAPKRTLAIGVASGLVSLVLFWLLAGQALPALADYLRNSIEVVGGYVEAMGVEDAGPAGQWHLLVILGSAAVVSALVWTSFPDLDKRRRAAILAGVLLFHYFILREVFLRHSLARGTFIVLLVPIVLMIPWPRRRRGLSLAIAAALGVAYLACYTVPPGEIWAPKKRTKAIASQFRDALDSDRVDQLVADGKAGMRAVEYAPTPPVIRALRGRCVHAEPVEVVAIWAYNLDWCPLPAFQSYTAYTSRLDQLNADRYADPEEGPNGILRGAFAIDARHQAWESPKAMLALLCNFVEVEHDAIWQALVRVPDRCGEPRPAGEVEGELGSPIDLPPLPRDAVLVAHVEGMEIGGVERLKMIFGRPEERLVMVDEWGPYRVVPDTVGSGLTISVPPWIDYPSPFNLGFAPRTLTPSINGQEGQSVTIRLTEVPIRRAAGT
jgi:hypothetical protein